MNSIKIQRIVLFVGIIVLCFVFLFYSKTNAQTNDANIILTWSAKNFYPVDFIGKPLPTHGTRVFVSLEVVRDGKPTDITSSPISWYVDGDFIESTVGEKTFSFFAKKTSTGGQIIRVKTQNNNSPIESSITIPVIQPETVVEVPYFSNIVSSGQEISLKAIPYFFNNSSLDQLLFIWQFGDTVKKIAGQNSLSLRIGKPLTLDQKKFFIKTSIQNQNNPLEYANKSTILTIQ